MLDYPYKGDGSDCRGELKGNHCRPAQVSLERGLRGDSKNRVAVGTEMLSDHDTDVTLEIGLNL
jgi:hypothetical protein